MYKEFKRKRKICSYISTYVQLGVGSKGLDPALFSKRTKESMAFKATIPVNLP